MVKKTDKYSDKILLVEDNENLSLLIERRLKKLAYQTERVFTGDEALEKLKQKDYKLMILDYQLPEMSAKKLVEELECRQPFIIMTGYGNEKTAVEMMKQGAYDYLVKDQNFLELLPAAVISAIERIEKEERIWEINQLLDKQREEYKLLFESTGTVMMIVEEDMTISLLNKEFERLTGYAKKEIMGKKIADLNLMTRKQKEKNISLHKNRLCNLEQTAEEYETEIVTKAGERRSLYVHVRLIKATKQSIISILDITEREKKEKELKKAYQYLDENIKQAQRLHELFLPTAKTEVAGWKLAAYYQATDRLGGDFYNYYQKGDKLVFYMADVSGNGLDGAMLNLIISERIDNLASISSQPEEMIRAVFERYLEEDFPEDYFVCLQLGVLNLETGRLKYSNAGFQILPFAVDYSGRLNSLSSSSFPITTAVPVEEFKFIVDDYKLKPGEKLLLTTDGLIEIMNDGELYSEDRLKETLKEYYYLPPQILIEKIERSFNSFNKQEKINDDITFFILENKGSKMMSEEIKSTSEEMYDLEERMVDFLKPYVTDIDMLRIGFHEIFTNALEHGNQDKKELKVKLKITINKSYVRITIVDEGSGFDWYKKIEKDLDYADFSERGRGIIMTEAVYDHVYYNQKGNQACLIKFRE